MTDLNLHKIFNINSRMVAPILFAWVVIWKKILISFSVRGNRVGQKARLNCFPVSCVFSGTSNVLLAFLGYYLPPITPIYVARHSCPRVMNFANTRTPLPPIYMEIVFSLDHRTVFLRRVHWWKHPIALCSSLRYLQGRRLYLHVRFKGN